MNIIIIITVVVIIIILIGHIPQLYVASLTKWDFYTQPERWFP